MTDLTLADKLTLAQGQRARLSMHPARNARQLQRLERTIWALKDKIRKEEERRLITQ